MPTSLVTADNPHCCSSACIVSLLNDSGDLRTQKDIFAQYSEHFPQWTHRPGFLAGKDFLKMLDLVGINYGRSFVEQPAQVVSHYNHPQYVAAFIITRRFYDPKNGELTDLAHSMRLDSLNEDTISVMNPCGGTKPAEIHPYTWEQFQTWLPVAFFLMAPATPSTSAQE